MTNTWFSLLIIAGLQSELSSAYGDDLMHLLPVSSSGSGSNLPDPEEGANCDVLARRLQRKMAQKEAQQRYRCAPYPKFRHAEVLQAGGLPISCQKRGCTCDSSHLPISHTLNAVAVV